MNLLDLYEDTAQTTAKINTARGIAKEIYQEMQDLYQIQQAGAATGPGNPGYAAKLATNIRELAAELDSMGFEFDPSSPGMVRPLTIDMPQPQLKIQEQQCPQCGGPAFSDLMLAEKQDACYHKVRSRYRVWPSAYASGALVQCRKKGAANWGNKSRKD